MEALLFGLSIGFVSGISPGPLMTLVLTSTLERGFRAGVLTSIAPLVSDAPIVLLSLLLLRQLPMGFLAPMTVAGGLFIIWIGIQTIRSADREQADEETAADERRILLRASLVNFLNPHPWLFWMTAGSTFLIRQWQDAAWQAVAFLVAMYALLVGSKIAVAWATARGRRFLDSHWYRRLLVACGLLLVGLGVALIWQAFGGLPAGTTPPPS